jgi:hypothetical protein
MRMPDPLIVQIISTAIELGALIWEFFRRPPM